MSVSGLPLLIAFIVRPSLVANLCLEERGTLTLLDLLRLDSRDDISPEMTDSMISNIHKYVKMLIGYL